jgi:cytochrome c oxidase assembly protein subunit 15
VNPWPLTLAYTVFVILFGAVVRVTGSGAGCGQHWPTCHGEIAHLPQSLETLIELSHRVTSALCGVLVLVGLGLTWRARGPRHLATRAGWSSLFFVLVEGLVGALLVRLELVENDASVLRAVVMTGHLLNTEFLTLALLIAAWAFGKNASKIGRGAPGQLALIATLGITILVVSGSGAVTALGDTVLPAREGGAAGAVEVLGQLGGRETHFLERLRGVHPVLATLGACLLFWYTDRLAPGWGRRILPWAIGAQVAAGVSNVWLSAPGWMQIVHLGLANLVWLAFCLASLETLGQGAPRSER